MRHHDGVAVVVQVRYREYSDPRYPEVMPLLAAMRGEASCCWGSGRETRWGVTYRADVGVQGLRR